MYIFIYSYIYTYIHTYIHTYIRGIRDAHEMVVLSSWNDLVAATSRPSPPRATHCHKGGEEDLYPCWPKLRAYLVSSPLGGYRPTATSTKQ